MTAAETWTPGPNATRPFADIFCYWDAQPPMSRIAITAVRAGWAVIPVFPSDKRPMCTLTARERNRIAPHPSNSSLCGAGHAIIKDKVAERVFKRLEADYPGLNIGIVARPSGVVVVDADVPAAVDSFRQDWATTTHDEGYLTFGPTVTTPGAKNRNGEMKHHNGGHWYFWLPPGLELPTDCQQLSGPGGYDVRWGDVYTVAPPSRRPEGRYIANGDCLEIPGFLVEMILNYGRNRAQRRHQYTERFANDPIAQWSQSVTWLELLCRHDWRETGKADRRCGCPVFEKPGGGSTGDRSATAHDDGCELYENFEGHGPLHLWTTDPPEPLASWCRQTGKSTLTKLEFVSIMEYDGDVDRAKVALGIEPDFGAGWFSDLTTDGDGQGVTTESSPLDENDHMLRILQDLPEDDS